jgi:RecB family exonuclease
MPRRLYSASPSRLTTYQDCPRRYRLQYLDTPRPPSGPPWAHNALGSSVHAALLAWWDLPADQRTPESGGRLVEERWIDQGYRDARQSDILRARARADVEAYLVGVDPSQEPIGRERTVAVRTEHAALSGRVDRIDEAGDAVVVVDYKTGRTPSTIDDARSSVALSVYAAGAETVFHRRCVRVELHHLPTTTVVAWESSPEWIARHLGRLDSLCTELQAADDTARSGIAPEAADELFPANVGPLCGWCDFRESCAEGSSVPRRPSWAGVVERGEE